MREGGKIQDITIKAFEMKLRFISLLFLCFCFVNCLAQDGLVWMRFFDADSGYDWEQYHDVYVTMDNDYIVVGHSNCFIIAIKYDRNGDMVWSEVYGDGGYDAGLSVIECDNGDFVIGGRLAVNGRSTNFLGMRISEDGEVIWMIDYGVGSCSAVIELKDGRFALAGEVGDNVAGIIIINGDGEEINRRAYPHGANSSFRAIRESDEGIVGVCQWRGGRVWMAEVDFDLEPLWIQDYDFVNARSVGVRLNSLVSTNSGYAFCVSVTLEPGNSHRPEILSVDPNGQLIWRQRYDLRNEPYETLAIFNLGRHGLLSAGGQSVASLMNVDNRGEPQWQASYYTERNDDYETTWFESVTIDREGDIIACGLGMRRDCRRGCGLIAKIDGLQLQPLVLEWSPRDSMLTVLPGDSIEFAIHAQARNEDALRMEYWVQDTLFAAEDTITIPFDSLGVFLVEGRVFYEESITSIRWHVTVTDLYIAAYSPDTLSLALRRGTSQTFSLDTVRAVEGDPVEYQWTLTNLDNFEREATVAEASATIEFLRSGNYQMEGLAYRGESSDNVIWTIAVRSAILDFWPRELRLSVPPDSSGEFGVIPFNPESDSLSYRWEVDGDSVGSDSTVALRFAWNGQAGRSTYAVSAIVMDGVEGDTVRWEVTVQDPNATPPTPPSIEGGENATTFGIVSVNPNPFNNSTTIRFAVPFGSESAQSAKSAVRLTVHDLTGREVVRLVDERAQQSTPSRGGPYAVTFNGKDLPAGIYLIRLQAGEAQKVAKVVLVR